MLSNLLITLLSALGVLVLGGLFVVIGILILSVIRIVWASCTKAVSEYQTSKEKKDDNVL